MAATPTITVPEGFTLYTENNANILLATNEAFLNPVQEFNRDLSVACIRVWSELLNKERESKWKEKKEKKTQKALAKRQKLQDDDQGPGIPKDTPYRPHKIVILEALSATGLRSIRYAKEIPQVDYVIANDLSPAAAESMRRNVELNGLGTAAEPDKVRVNEGDACSLMYSHREDRRRVDVVDLDPYGTASPFIDAAVQCIKDGGLLCITCTDLPVLGTTNYPEKCFSNYGGVSVRAEYCHEVALRLVLHAISTSAARYGRFIQPVLSLSIDFYVRLFVRVTTSPMEVKRAITKTSVFYVCNSCQSFYEQPLGRTTEKINEVSGNVTRLFRTHGGPPVSELCPECQSALYTAGPMWSGSIHDPDFTSAVLEHLEANHDNYGTSTRMKGMLTIAKEELPTPFYFTPTKVASFFHCQTPSLDEVASALLHAGYQVSRSHASAGSLKTTASRAVVYDIFRSWIKNNPVKMENIGDRSPAQQLLSKEPRTEAIFTRHPNSVTASSQVKLVRYQENPTSHWGPGTKVAVGKRKRNES